MLRKIIVSLNIMLGMLIVVFIYKIGANLWCAYVPVVSRTAFDDAKISRVFDCDIAMCSAEFSDYGLTLKFPKPVTVGERYNLLYEQVYSRRTEVVWDQRLLRADKIKTN